MFHVVEGGAIFKESWVGFYIGLDESFAFGYGLSYTFFKDDSLM
jgi:hypothetical protein